MELKVNVGLKSQMRLYGAHWPNLDEDGTHVIQQPQVDQTSPATSRPSSPAGRTSAPPKKLSYLRHQ